MFLIVASLVYSLLLHGLIALAWMGQPPRSVSDWTKTSAFVLGAAGSALGLIIAIVGVN